MSEQCGLMAKPAVSNLVKRSLERASSTRFSTSSFSFIEPTWATDQCVKIFSNLDKNSPSYSNFAGYAIPRGVCFQSVEPKI